MEEGDDPAACATALHEQLSPVWAKHALKELAWVSARCGDNKHEFTQTSQGARAQLKSML